MDNIIFKMEGYSSNPEALSVSEGLLGKTEPDETFPFDEMDMSTVEMCGQEEDSVSMDQAEDSFSDAHGGEDEAESYSESTPELVDLESGSEEDRTVTAQSSSRVSSLDSAYPADAADVKHDHIFAKTSKPSRRTAIKSERVQPQLLKPKPPLLPNPVTFPQYVFYSSPDSNVYQLGQLEFGTLTSNVHGLDGVKLKAEPVKPEPTPVSSLTEVGPGQTVTVGLIPTDNENLEVPEEEVVTGDLDEPEIDLSAHLHGSRSSFSKKKPRRPGANSDIMKSSVLNISVPGGMSMQLQRYIYTEALCRVCLLPKPNMSPIFEDVNITDDGSIENSRGPNASTKFNLIPALKQIMDIDVSYGDALPDQICFECNDNLMTFSEFRKRISVGQDKLTEILEQVKNSSAPTVIPQLGLSETTVPNFYRHADLMNNVRVMLRCTKYTHNVVRYLPDRILEKIFNVISTTVGFKSDKLKSLETYAVDPPYAKAWFCAVCRATIHGSTKDFTQHFQVEHGLEEKDVLFPCDFCDDHFPLLDKTGLSTNYATHWIQHFFFYECDICQKRMPSAKGVWVHKRSSHSSNSRPFKCPTCSKAFIKKSHLVTHSRTHLIADSKKLYRSWCTICGKGINSSLSNHMNSVHKDEVRKDLKWKCEVCSRQFTKKENLVNHRKTAHENIDCVCEICGERFLTFSAKSLHVLKHEGSLPYPCDQCFKKFPSGVSLRSHKLTEHNPASVFTCGVCSKSFKRKMYLAEHMKMHAEPQHLCPYPGCSKVIRLKSNWYKHLKVHEKRGDGNRPSKQQEEEPEVEAFEITLNLEPE